MHVSEMSVDGEPVPFDFLVAQLAGVKDDLGLQFVVEFEVFGQAAVVALDVIPQLIGLEIQLAALVVLTPVLTSGVPRLASDDLTA